LKSASYLDRRNVYLVTHMS